jgi:uncharacterized beta-barrel protein YwiB (DUF1934 family)
MARDILVTVRGKQINQKEPEDTNTSEIVTNGKFHSKDENFFISYSTIEEDKSVTNNRIKVEKDKIEVIKKGSINSKMVFKKGQKNLTNYVTTFGTIEIRVITNNILIKETDAGLQIDLDYVLEFTRDYKYDCKINVGVQYK